MFNRIKNNIKSNTVALLKSLWSYFLTHQSTLLLLVLLLTLLDVFANYLVSFKGIHLPFEIRFLLLWLLVGYFFLKFKEHTSLLIAIIFLAVTPILLFIGVEDWARKAAAVAYVFLVLGMIQKVISLTKPKAEESGD